MSKAKPTKTPPTAPPATNKTEVRILDGRQFFLLLKTGIAKKIAKQADGSIGYQVVADPDRSKLYISITSNDGGGYFSKELVEFGKIERCLKNIAEDVAFPSKSFRPAFVGKSTCNPGFISAVLRHLGLITLAPATETQHVLVGDWGHWQTNMLTEPGETIEIAILVAAKPQAEGVQEPNT